MADERHPFEVSAPASTANLGPGFDLAGAALELRNTLVVSPGTGQVVVTGEGADTLPASTDNLVVRAMEQAAPGFHAIVDIECHNEIPLARGLGSSAAAAALGLVAGWTLIGERWDAAQLTRELAALDGHPDNAAACAYGGMTLARTLTDGEVRVLSVQAPDWLALVAVVPERELSTAAARAALPASYARPTVARALGHVGFLAGALAMGDRSLFAEVLECDVVHEPFRASLVPELDAVRSAVRGTQAYGATLSGAGPTVAVWCPPDEVDAVVARVEAAVPAAGVRPLAVAGDGVLVRH